MSIRFLSASEWRLLRSARLDALRESPTSFLSTFAEERQYGQQRWEAELGRGDWLVRTSDDASEAQALLGATRGADIPAADRYLSYLWVAPAARGRGLGTTAASASSARTASIAAGTVRCGNVNAPSASGTVRSAASANVPSGPRYAYRLTPRTLSGPPVPASMAL